ncbi:hypothetical protein [Microbispora sp. NPDC046933]
MDIAVTWFTGCPNCRQYWMNACTSPTDSAPAATLRPPMTATST